MTVTKISSRKPSGTYGHGPLKICFWKGKDDDHDQDFLKKDLLHIWSWSSDKSSSTILKPGNHPSYETRALEALEVTLRTASRPKPLSHGKARLSEQFSERPPELVGRKTGAQILGAPFQS